jgi:hypothetical protein
MPATQHALPLASAILQDMQATLAAIRAGATYKNTLIVERLKKEGNAPRDRLALIVRGPFRPADEEALGVSDRIQTVYVIVYAAHSDASAVEIEDRLLTLEADIEKALCNSDASFNRNGLAAGGTYLTDGIPFQDEESGFDGSVLIFDVYYRSTRDDPYTY